MSANTFKKHNNINSLQKKNIYQKFWGARAPLATPLVVSEFQFDTSMSRRATKIPELEGSQPNERSSESLDLKTNANTYVNL